MTHTPNARATALLALGAAGCQPAVQTATVSQPPITRPTPVALPRRHRLAALLAAALLSAHLLNSLAWAFAPMHAHPAKVAVTRPVGIRS